MPRACPDDGGRLYGVALGVSESGTRAILYIPGVGLRHCPAHETEPAHEWEVAAAAGWDTTRIAGNVHARRELWSAQYGKGESFRCLPDMYESQRDALAAAFPRIRRDAADAYARVYGGDATGALFDMRC
jgi:hypothetical protein